MILYFSGTGNSGFIADELCCLLGEKSVSLNDKIKRRDNSVEQCKRYIFVFPIYAGRIPKIVEKWIDNTDFPKGAAVYFIGTCSHIAGSIEDSLRRMSHKNGLRYRGFDFVYMPQNHITLYSRESDEIADKMVQTAVGKTKIIAENIRRNQPFPRKRSDIKGFVLSNISYHIFYKTFLGAKKFRTTKSCVGCGACAKVCPLSNIRMENGNPIWSDYCTHCMACISRCPKNAIEYGTVTVGRQRNRCIRFSEKMLKEKENMLDFISVNTHSSIRIADEKIIYIDPFRIKNEPHDADIILITHSHYDHFSPEDIRKVMRKDAVLVCPKSVTAATDLGLKVRSVSPQESFMVKGISMETVPAYNKLKPFHPKFKGWVGYLIHSVENCSIYIAGDTDMTDESMKVQCRVALLPIGGTYTLNAAQAAKLANTIKPKYVIPVHYGSVVGKPEDADDFIRQLDSGIQAVVKINSLGE